HQEGEPFRRARARKPRAPTRNDQEVTVKRLVIVLSVLVGLLGALVVSWDPGAQVSAQQGQTVNVPKIPFESVPDYFKYPATMNLGEVLAVAVNSKGHVLMLNHPGSGTSGPLYGNASTQLLEFDEAGKFLREVGRGVYGLGYAHGARYDKYDNLWIVDKGTHTAMRFNPAGYVTLNLGRRPEGPDEPDYYKGNGLGRGGSEGRPAAQHVDGLFRAPTDIAWDSDDNIYISDGYINSRVAKFDKHGNWIKSWGSRGSGGPHA